MHFFDAEAFSYAANAVVPLILLFAVGYLLKIIGMFDQNFFKSANKFVFKIGLPVLLFYNIYNISDIGSLRMDVVAYALILVMVIFFLGMLTVKLTIQDVRQKGVVLQCIFRSNYAIIGIPISEALGGTEAIAIAALLSAFSIPIYNVLAVVSLSIYNEGSRRPSMRSVLKKIAQNPLIIGVMCGIAVIALRSFMRECSGGADVFTIKSNLPFVYSAIQSLSRIASPLALVVLGGQFTFSAVKGMKRQIFIATFWRLVLSPLIGLLPAVLLTKYTGLISYGMLEYPALVALFSTPVAVSSAIMAGEMDNDEALAGQLVVWTCLFSVFTMFITIVLIRMSVQ